MDVESILDQSGFCRLCVVNYDPPNMTEIFDEKVFGSNSLAEKIKTVTNIEVERNGLPTSICARCVTELNNAYNFVQTCIAGDNFLCNELFEAQVQMIAVEPSLVDLQIKEETETSSEHCTKPDLDLPDLFQNNSDDFSYLNGLFDMPVLSPQVEPTAHCSDEDSSGETPILKTESYDCARCLAKFASRSSLKKHVVAGFKTPCKVGPSKEPEGAKDTWAGREDGSLLVSGAFQCVKCSKEFASKVSLENHMIGGTKVSCIHVSHEKSAPSNNGIAKLLPPKAFYCSKCLVKFSDKATCFAHIVSAVCRSNGSEAEPTKKPSENPQCPNCERPFLKLSLANRHLRSGLCMYLPGNGNKERPTCPSCYSSFSSKTNLRYHLLVYRCKGTSKEFSCFSCRRRFSRKANIRRHFIKGFCKNTAAVSASVTSIQCLYCRAEFGDIDGLRSHLLSRCKGRVWYSGSSMKTRCEICKKVFMTMELLRMHLQIGLCNKSQPISESIKKRQCPYCRLIFFDARDVTRHINLNRCTYDPSSIKSAKKTVESLPFQCAVCLAKCTSKTNLVKHIRSGCRVPCVLESKAPFKCKFCPRGFPLEKNLRVHLISHSKKRPYGCDVCAKRFKRKSNMQIHLELHKEDGNYECAVCEKIYKAKAKLKNHLRVHKVTRGPPQI